MSVILHNLETGKYLLLSKGADSVMFPRLTEKSRASEIFASTKVFCDDFATEGLRTLILAERLMTKDEVDKYLIEHQHAINSLVNREQKLEQVYDTIEHSMEMIGSTAIEDKL
jgi:magnesium-transporting ATPase (P-type)